jgi:hypothetical protein
MVRSVENGSQDISFWKFGLKNKRKQIPSPTLLYHFVSHLIPSPPEYNKSERITL